MSTLTNRNALKSRGRILVARMAANALDLGELLYEVDQKGLHAKWGFSTVHAWAEKDLALARRHSQRLRQVHEKVRIPTKGKVAKSRLAALGLSKLRALAAYVRPSVLPEWITKAEKMTVVQLERAVKGKTRLYTPFSINLTVEERKALDMALTEIRHREGIRRKGAALQVLINEWDS
jgi:hypothetical protein